MSTVSRHVRSTQKEHINIHMVERLSLMEYHERVVVERLLLMEYHESLDTRQRLCVVDCLALVEYHESLDMWIVSHSWSTTSVSTSETSAPPSGRWWSELSDMDTRVDSTREVLSVTHGVP